MDYSANVVCLQICLCGHAECALKVEYVADVCAYICVCVVRQ